MWLPENPDRAAPIRRALPALLAAMLIALVIALSGMLKLIDGAIVVELCAILVLLVIAFYALLRSGVNLRFVDSSLITAQVATLFVFLAYAALRAADFGAALMLLYPAVMLAGVLRLSLKRVAWLAGLAVLTNLVAIFVVALSSTNTNPDAIFVHVVALVAVLGFFVCAARSVARLRTNLSYTARQLEVQREAAAGRARRDELTGAYSRGYLVDTLGREIARSERSGRPLCISCISIDHFQDIDAIVSKTPGESLLARFSAAAHGVVRSVDVFGRWGATQFMLIMPETEINKAEIGAQRLRAPAAAIAWCWANRPSR